MPLAGETVTIFEFPREHEPFILEKPVKPLEGAIPTLPVVPAFEVKSMCFRPPRRPSKHRRRDLSDTPRPASDPPPTDLCRGRIPAYPA